MESPSPRFPDIGPVQIPYPLDRSASLACATDLDGDDQSVLSLLKSLAPLPALKTAESKTCESGENFDDLLSTIDKYSALLEILAGGPTGGGKETFTPLTRSLSPPPCLPSHFMAANEYHQPAVTPDALLYCGGNGIVVTPGDQTRSPFSECSELSLPQSHLNMPSIVASPTVEYGIAPSEVWLDPFPTERTKEIPAAIDGHLAHQAVSHPLPMANLNVQKPARPCAARAPVLATTASLPPTPPSHYSSSPSYHDELPFGKCRGRPVPTLHDLKAIGDEEKRPYVCKVKNCFKSFKRNEHCIRHAKDMHSPKPKLPCPAIGCTVEVKRKDNLYQHMRTHPFQMFPPGTKMPPALPKKPKKRTER